MELPRGFLALPDDRSAETLRRKVRLLALRRLLIAEAPGLGAPLARLRAVLARLARGPEGPGLVRAVGALDVMVPLLCLEAEMAPAEGMIGRAVPPLLASLGRHLPRGTLRESLLWDVPVAALVDPPRRIAFEGQGLLLEPTGVEARTAAGASFDLGEPAAGVRYETVLFPIVGGVSLSLADENPLAMLEEHPDKGGNAIDLGGREPAAWCTALGEALGLIEAALPVLHGELVQTVERIVPVGYEPERHLSASYREAPGLIYLTLHPSSLTLAEALVHESQHGKLNLLRWFDPVLENGTTAWTSSPVRPDLRPLLGVLMAVHAFVPVAALHLALAAIEHPVSRTPSFARRRAEVLAANERGLATLRELARPTLLGERVLAAIHELHGAVRDASAPTAAADSLDALG
jgi:HEXXH motif-containing protein